MGKIAELIVQLGADNEDLRRGLKKARTDMEKFQESAKTISNSMIGLGAAAVGAIGGIVKSASDWAAAVNDIEDKTGMAGQSASKLLYIAKAVGLETADAADAVTKMSRSVAQAVEQQEKATIAGRESVDVYTKYGIAIKDANGNMLSTTQILANIAEKHRAMANGIQKTNMEMEIFGRSGAKLNDMLNLTSEQIAKMTENAHRAGLVMDGETTQAWEDLTIQMNETKMVMMGVAVQIGNALLPSIKELARMISNGAKKFSNLSETEKEVIMFTLKTATVMGGLGLAIRAVTFTCGPMVEGIMSIVKALLQMRNMAITAKAATMGLMATAAVAGFAVIDGAIEKYNAFNKAGVDGLTYNTENPWDDQIGINYNAVDKVEETEKEEKLKQAQEAAEKAEREAVAKSQALTGMDFGGVPSVGGGGGGSVDHSLAESKRQAEELAEKIKDIQANIADSNKEAINLARNFEESGIVLEESLLVGSEKVKVEIEAEARQRNAVLDDYLERYKESVVEAERLRQEAEATGNAELIKQATAYLEERKQAEIQAEQEIQDRRIAIREEAERKATAISTQAREIQADLQRAFDEGDLASYVALLDEKHAKFLTDLQEKQALMQAYYDWRMQAEETQAKLQIDVMNKLKDGLSSAFADAVVNSKNLIGSIMELGKQIVAMYIKERIQQAISSMFTKKKIAADTAASTAAAATATAAWTPAAMAASIATGGTAAKTGSLAMQTAMALSPTLSSMFGVPKFAKGGLVYGPTLGLIGEGQHSEAVLPLSENTYSQLAKGINEQGGGNSVVLNVSAIDASGFESWLRRTGGNTIKKYLSDQRLEFKLEGGII